MSSFVFPLVLWRFLSFFKSVAQKGQKNKSSEVVGPMSPLLKHFERMYSALMQEKIDMNSLEQTQIRGRTGYIVMT